MVQQAKEEFWDRWVKEVFPSLLRQQKWFKYKRDTKVGDVVLRKDETAGQTYKYARVTKVHVGTDGKVRAADIEYKVPGEARFRSTTRPIHKLVLIVPVEEQVIEEDEGGEVDQEFEARDGYGEEDNETQQGESNDKEETQKTEDKKQLSPETETDKEAESGTQDEEADLQLQKELGRTSPGVQFSDRLEEIVDVGAALRRGRGRPKKAGITASRSRRRWFPGSTQGECNGQCGGDVCWPWGNGSHLGSRGSQGTQPAKRGIGRAVGIGQWRRIDITKCLRT
jgi:hypothetical protein